MIKIITHTENPELILQDAHSKCYQKPIKVPAMVKVSKHESVLEHVTFIYYCTAGVSGTQINNGRNL